MWCGPCKITLLARSSMYSFCSAQLFHEKLLQMDFISLVFQYPLHKPQEAFLGQLK